MLVNKKHIGCYVQPDLEFAYYKEKYKHFNKITYVLRAIVAEKYICEIVGNGPIRLTSDACREDQHFGKMFAPRDCLIGAVHTFDNIIA